MYITNILYFTACLAMPVKLHIMYFSSFLHLNGLKARYMTYMKYIHSITPYGLFPYISVILLFFR